MPAEAATHRRDVSALAVVLNPSPMTPNCGPTALPVFFALSSSSGLLSLSLSLCVCMHVISLRKYENKEDEFCVFNFRYLEIDSRAWEGLEETVTYSIASHHVGAVSSIFSPYFLSSRVISS